ncbi:TetR/AcrR family transcriptional regulator, partial [Escherichia coli]|uniref:helix-turn-helix domain-containing protein n=1 Tax=Escherichia coli TaxID=562 RepID=UPI00211472A9
LRLMRTRRQPQDPLLGRILAAPGEDSGEATDRILDGAMSQAEEFGLRRFTMDDVARRVGVSRVTVYRYFPKKDQLIEAILLRELRRFL